MDHNPKKLDLNVVDFPAALEPLVEILAEAVHEGQHEDLPESEKAHYRQMARTMLAVLLANGCRIEMPTRLLKKESAEPVEVLQKVPADDDVELAITWGKLTEKDALTIRDWISAANRKLVDLEKGDPRCQRIYDIAKRIKTTYMAFFMEAHDLSTEAFKKV